jgi:hypothetical protein
MHDWRPIVVATGSGRKGGYLMSISPIGASSPVQRSTETVRGTDTVQQDELELRIARRQALEEQQQAQAAQAVQNAAQAAQADRAQGVPWQGQTPGEPDRPRHIDMYL